MFRMSLRGGKPPGSSLRSIGSFRSRPWWVGPERLTMMASAMIVVLATVAVMLGIGYLQTARESHRRAAARSGAAAHSILVAVINESVQSGWGVLLETFVPAFSVGSRGAHATLDSMDELARAYAANCGCDAMTPAAIVLANVNPGELLEASGPGRIPLSEPWRRPLLAFADSAPLVGRQVSVVPLVDGPTPAIAYVRVVRGSRQRRISAAIVVPVSELGPKVFERARRRVQSAMFGDSASADSSFGLAVRFGESTLVYESGWMGPGPEWTTRFWTDENPLLVATVTLNPTFGARNSSGANIAPPLELVAAASGLLILVATAGVFALRRATQLIVSRTLFLSSVSHELRTPMTQIRLYAELLQDSATEPSRRARAIEVIARETRRLIHMIENVLLYSRSSQHDLSLSCRDVMLAGSVREVLADFEAIYSQSGSRISAVLESPRSVQADPTAVRQILTNLLDNATRYGPKGQLVRVVVADEGERVLLTVEDEGPGVPSEVLRALHQRRAFVRGAGSGTGAGIGLALTRRLADAMNATVSVELGSGGALSRVCVSFQAATES